MNTTRVEALQQAKEAREEIANPIKFMQERAKAEGMQLNGQVAVSMASDANYLRSIAEKAIAALATVSDASPSPVSVPSDEQMEKARDAVAEALGDAYDCTRAWSAWGYETMTRDDFSLVAEDSDRLAEITDAAIKAILSTQPAAQTQGAGQALPDEQIRFRFFKNLNDAQRLAVFKAFGVYPDNCNESLNHGIERRLLDDILKRKPASQPAPSVLDGWKVVPTKATDEMIDAACEAANMYRVDVMRAIEAAIVAAPSAPSVSAPVEMETGWLVENGKQGDELRYRTMESGLPEWTADPNKAIRFARRIDAEWFAQEDEDAWAVVQHAWHDMAASAPSVSTDKAKP